MYVGWNGCETGAPEINPKRPYGNSGNVANDILPILGIPYDGDNEALEDFARKLHEEMEDALQIFLCTQSFEIGKYEKESEYDSRSWKKVIN